jgi:hypothetical protein
MCLAVFLSSSNLFDSFYTKWNWMHILAGAKPFSRYCLRECMVGEGGGHKRRSRPGRNRETCAPVDNKIPVILTPYSMEQSPS